MLRVITLDRTCSDPRLTQFELRSFPFRNLLRQCDEEGLVQNALVPTYHCMHTPGGPLKYSLEGHQFAVFGFKLTSDFR